MNASSRFVHWIVWGLLGLVVFSVATVFFSTSLRPPPKPLPVYGQIPDFKLTNQLGQAVTLDHLKGHVWIVDIIFTRCPGPCLSMTRKMKAIQDALPPNTSIRLVSLTADPAFDTPAVLQKYASRFNASPSNWLFLTGPKQDVYNLAIHGLKLAVQENPDLSPVENQFIHSTRFVLIDQQGRIRGLSYEGTEPQVVAEIVSDAQQLQREK